MGDKDEFIRSLQRGNELLRAGQCQYCGDDIEPALTEAEERGKRAILDKLENPSEEIGRLLVPDWVRYVKDEQHRQFRRAGRALAATLEETDD